MRRYCQWHPPTGLEDVVETLWYSRSDAAQNVVIPPDGRRDIIWRFVPSDACANSRAPVAFQSEATRTPLRVTAEPGQIWVGARLRPGVIVPTPLPPLREDPPTARSTRAELSARFLAWLRMLHFEKPPVYIRQATREAHLTGGRSSVSDLCQSAGVTPRYLLRGFTRHIGFGPKDYLAIMRINRTLQLRAQSSMSLTQIAAECGFSDQAHFSRSCRRLVGISPKNTSEDVILPRLPLL